jgi:Flp pilus assembly protein TadD
VGRSFPPPSLPLSRRRLQIYICLTLVALTCLVFAQVAHFQFVNWDDDRNVYRNPMVQAGLSFDGVVWAFTDTKLDYWHPLTWLSHMLDAELFGGDAGWHHLTSVFIHILNVLLLFLVFCRMTGAVWRSAIVAALFAIHPLRAESVAWVTERKDVLAGLFWWLATWAYIEYAGKTGSWKRYSLVIFLFALALMAKPGAATLPFALLLLDYWPLDRLRQGIGTLVREKVPLFALSAISLVLTFQAQRNLGTMQMLGHLTVPVRIANSLVSYVAYLVDTFWPARLAALYPFDRNIPAWRVAGAILLLVAVTAFVLWKASRFRYLAVGWFWYLGVLLPVIGLVQMGLQSRADRFTYIPLAGIFVLIVWGVNDLMAGWRHRTSVAVALIAVAVPALGVRAWSQVGTWRDGVTLFQHNVKVTPRNEFALLNLGQALDYAGRSDEAIASLTAVVRLNPNTAVAYDGLGNIQLRKGNLEEALANYSQEIRISPNANAHYHRGAILNVLGRPDEALPELEMALSAGLPPAFAAHARAYLGSILSEKGRYAEAARQFSQALNIDPDFLAVRKELGIALMKLGKIGEAREQFMLFLAAYPDDAEVRQYLNH